MRPAVLLLAAIAAALLGCTAATNPTDSTDPAPATAADPRPNIIFFMADDMDALLNGYDPAYGPAHMANLNRLVRQRGTLFTSYVLAYPLCSPCRSTVLTARYPHNTGFINNNLLNGSRFHPVQEENTIATWLHDSGYQTMLAGKYMNGYHTATSRQSNYCTYVPPGWTNWYALQSIGYFGSRINVDGKSVLYPETAYQTDVLANISSAWLLNKYDPSKGPFFMWLTPHAPHAPYTPAPRHAGTLKGLVQPNNPALNEAKALQATLPGRFAALSKVNEATMDTIYEKRAESLLAVDEWIGRLFADLERRKLTENTYFFFTSDNGYHLGEHRLSPGKREAFQHDINVPMVVFGPGVPANRTRSELIGNYDLAQTWLELAGAKANASAPPQDGVSFAALLKPDPDAAELQPSAWRRTFTLQEGWESQEGTPYHGLRWVDPSINRNTLFVRFQDNSTAFFDVDRDPWQTNNTYATLSSADRAAYEAQLAAVRACTGTACPGH